MIIENKRIDAHTTGKRTIGHIKLDKLAIPETVKVTLQGEQIIPESFNIYGHPNFTEEQQKLFMFAEEEFTRKNNGEYTPLKAEIVYEERIFEVPRSTFDTMNGIKKSLLSLSDLNEMLQNRMLFHMAHPNEPLNEFMIFGCFWLDEYAQITSLKKTQKDNANTYADVEEYQTFKMNNSKNLIFTSDGYDIPAANSICPCCNKQLTIDDIKNNPCVYIDGKFYHDSCWRNYRKLIEVDKFTRQLMNCIYKEKDYKFELLPNGYCHEDCCSHIPWFLFHTIDGDIIMGWRKRVISIEWQENYKSFDMDELFSEEEVTKWDEAGKRGIHAWGKEKACEYLKKVLKEVNPGYSKY